MATNTPRAKNSSHDSSTAIRPTYIHAFRDEYGNDYIYRTIDETVHIIHEGRRRQIMDLSPRTGFTIEAFYTQVASQRDLERVGLEADTGSALASQLEGF